MRTFTLEPAGPAASHLVQLLANGDLVQLGKVALGAAALCTLAALVKAVFGRIPIVEKLSDGRGLSTIDADEWCEGALIAATFGGLLILCAYPIPPPRYPVRGVPSPLRERHPGHVSDDSESVVRATDLVIEISGISSVRCR